MPSKDTTYLEIEMEKKILASKMLKRFFLMTSEHSTQPKNSYIRKHSRAGTRESTHSEPHISLHLHTLKIVPWTSPLIITHSPV